MPAECQRANRAASSKAGSCHGIVFSVFPDEQLEQVHDKKTHAWDDVQTI